VSQAFSRVAHAIAPSVVRLEVSGAREDAVASGIILDTRGNVVTSSRVFDGWSPPRAQDDAEPITVVLPDGRKLGAELIGLDPASDVAVVRMFEPPRDLSAARFGDSDSEAAAVGEWVLVVGSPLGLDETFTAGIISGRPSGDAGVASARGRYLLTDANVNPGESGGPLVDLDGEVIGLATAMSNGPGGSYGYAVPINRARRVAAALIRDGRLAHPFIGVGLRDLDDLDSGERRRLGVLPARGAVISRVWRGAPAARAGLRPGDVITSVNDSDTPTPGDLVAAIARQEVGTRIVVGFVRGGAAEIVPVSIGERGPGGAPALPAAP
jgi:S1-C subfamily serine protease